MSDIVRVMRIIIYEGEREWLEKQIQNAITGTKILPKGKITVRTIEEFPEIIVKHDDLANFNYDALDLIKQQIEAQQAEINKTKAP
jgi:hypothetical protein